MRAPLITSACFLLTLVGSLAAPPGILNHQGRIAVNGANFGNPAAQTGHFKFSLVNASGATTFWSNTPDAAPSDGEPDGAVAVLVTKGHYSVALGDTTLGNMDSAIPSSVFADNDSVFLRTWFGTSAAGPFELLSPDRRITSTGYALSADHAGTAATADSLASSDLVGLTSLGVGTLAPDAELEVRGISPTLRMAAGNAQLSSLQLYEITGGNPFGFEFEYDGNPDQLNLWSRGFSGNEAIRMTWKKDGTVGIGTTNPTQALDVIGNIRSRGTDGGQFTAANPNNQGASANLGWLDDVARIRIGGSGAGAQNGLDIQTTSDRSLLRLTHAGDVGIGTTTPTAEHASTGLRVATGHVMVNNNFGFFSANAAGNGIGAGVDTTTSDTLSFFTAGGSRATLNSGGDLDIAGSYNMPSTTRRLMLAPPAFEGSASSPTRMEGTGAGPVLFRTGDAESFGYANLALPHGAVVTELAALMDDTSDVKLTVSLQRRNFSTATLAQATMAEVDSVGTGGKQLRVDSSISSPTIDNNTNTYWLQVHMEEEPFLGGGNLSLAGVRITYTITQPLP